MSISRGLGAALLLGLAACQTDGTIAAAETAAPARPVALAEPAEIRAEGDYTQPGSGIVFPTEIGRFRRVGLFRYDEAGLDVSGNYDLAQPRIRASLYVYPTPPAPAGDVAKADAAREAACQEEVALRKEEVRAFHPDARQRREERVALDRVGVSVPGALVEWEYAESFDGVRGAAGSRLYLFCHLGGHWFVKYRFTYPLAVEAEAEPEIAAFLADLFLPRALVVPDEAGGGLGAEEESGWTLYPPGGGRPVSEYWEEGERLLAEATRIQSPESDHIADLVPEERYVAEGHTAGSVAAAEIGGTVLAVNGGHPALEDQGVMGWVIMREALVQAGAVDQTVDGQPAYRHGSDWGLLERLLAEPNRASRNPDNLVLLTLGVRPAISDPPAWTAVAGPAGRYTLDAAEDPAARRFALRLRSEDDRDLCLHVNSWPNALGQVHRAQGRQGEMGGYTVGDMVAVVADGRRFPARPHNFGYCVPRAGDPLGCTLVVGPGEVLEGFVGFDQFDADAFAGPAEARRLDFGYRPLPCTH